MKKVFVLIAFVTIGLNVFAQTAVKDSVPVLTDSTSFVNYRHLEKLNKDLKSILVHPEFAKLNSIDQYNIAVKPLLDAMIAAAQKEWEAKEKKKPVNKK